MKTIIAACVVAFYGSGCNKVNDISKYQDFSLPSELADSRFKVVKCQCNGKIFDCPINYAIKNISTEKKSLRVEYRYADCTIIARYRMESRDGKIIAYPAGPIECNGGNTILLTEKNCKPALRASLGADWLRCDEENPMSPFKVDFKKKDGDSKILLFRVESDPPLCTTYKFGEEPFYVEIEKAEL